jgi:hypothetical protein
VDNYISVFPDKEAALLWDSEPVPFFMSPAIVKDRTDRYTLVADPLYKGQFNVRVYSAISVVGEQSFPADRAWALQQIYSSPEFIADASGAGGVWQRNAQQVTYRVSIISKLSMLGILKFSTLDPMGMGVEMEGGKPGWNDAMNGLPGLIGSGMAETYEMLRIIRYVKAALMRHVRAVQYPEEFSDFMIALAHALEVHDSSSGSQRDNHLYWDATNNAREMYRHRVSVTFSGVTLEVPSDRLILLLTAMEKKTIDGITRALQSTGGLSPSYFHYECVDYEVIPSKKNGTLPTAPRAAPLPPIVEIPKIACREFTTQSLPIFLEGPVRHMKILRSHDDRLAVYHATKGSDIYDPFLKMYRLSESLQDMRQDVGRMKAFTPGWLENQSIWLHMSYKFYLELLRGGLYTEFFEEISTGLVPFMNNTMYGRSPLEAASFIVSSVFPDKKLHGSSFLARLTGSTAEMMSIWSIMMAGHRPFILDTKGTLMLSLKPILPGWLFTENGTVSFKFLSDVLVTYHNPDRLDSWTLESKSIKVVYKDGISSEFPGGPLSEGVAESVRGLSVRSIDVYY